ncbi:MAG: CCA tRNA nucleotidyltransferase [Candidatus Methylacidiphilales bacterium]|nr:CCA tRNA nucleotidyltransferase [Candidatus Methylacidiphilales bacterium]
MSLLHPSSFDNSSPDDGAPPKSLDVAATSETPAVPTPAEMRATATRLVRRLQDAGHTAYFAGGCVRDQLLGVEAKDIDIATSARPDQVQALFPRVTDVQGECFGVVRVIENRVHYEVATFRRDGEYKDGRRPESVTFSSAEEDAHRRDFTINGLFYDPVRDEIIDFVGGRADLEACTIRAIGNPADRFAEDKLRLMRAVRFACTILRPGTNKPFKIEPETWAAIQHTAPEIAGISAERKRDELNKILTGPRPEIGLDLLDQSGLLAVVLPDISALHGVEQPPQFHPEGDVFTHVRLMMTHLRRAPLVLALSVLLHDVGKPATFAIDETGRIRFSDHENVGARMAEEILRDLRYSNDIIEQVVICVRYHMSFKDVMQMKRSTLLKLMQRPTFPIELELHRIDCLGCHCDLKFYDFLKSQFEAYTPDQIKPPRLITGKDLLAMGIPPGRQLGSILATIEEAQLMGNVQTYMEALALARKLAAEA